MCGELAAGRRQFCLAPSLHGDTCWFLLNSITYTLNTLAASTMLEISWLGLQYSKRAVTFVDWTSLLTSFHITCRAR